MNFLKYLFIFTYLKGEGTERERERKERESHFPFTGFTPQMHTRAGLGQVEARSPDLHGMGTLSDNFQTFMGSELGFSDF